MASPAVGTLERSTRAQIREGLAVAQRVWASADTGFTPGSWIDGAADVPAVLPADVRRRAAAIAARVDLAVGSGAHLFSAERVLIDRSARLVADSVLTDQTDR